LLMLRPAAGDVVDEDARAPGLALLFVFAAKDEDCVLTRVVGRAGNDGALAAPPGAAAGPDGRRVDIQLRWGKMTSF